MKKLMSVTAALVLATGLTACGSDEKVADSCTADGCRVTMEGQGASKQFSNENIRITLNEASKGGNAEFEIEGGEELKCKQGETIRSERLAITCVEVGDDKVTFDVKEDKPA